MPRPAPLTPEPRTHIPQREIIAKPCAELHQRHSRGVLALAAIRAVVIAVIDVRERCGFEGGEFHARERSAAWLWITGV